MLVSISGNVYRCCGCKSSTFIYISKGFYYIISMFFISRWYGGFYNTKFFLAFAGFGWFCLFWAGFATKAPGHKVLDSPTYYALLVCEKDTKRGFSLFLMVLAKTQRRKVFLFLPKNDYHLWKNNNFILETAPLAPIVPIPKLRDGRKSFCGGPEASGHHKRLKRTAG